MSRRRAPRALTVAPGLLVIAILGGAGAAAAAVAVEGLDRARVLPPAGARIDAYENAGYRLERVGDEVRITVEVTPLGSVAPYDPPAHWGEDGRSENRVVRLARVLVSGATREVQVASRILGWVSSHVAYDLDREADQSPEAVLERRTAFCTGSARLTVGLLRAAGLEAREVAGYVVGGTDEVAGFHRWVELRLSDRGWVFADPLFSHFYVPATYVRLASETVAPREGLEGVLLERRDHVAVVDTHPGGSPRVRARRNDSRQWAGSVTVNVFGDGVARLEGGGARRTRTLRDGRAVFVDLVPGAYRLEVETDHAHVERRLRLAGRERATYDLVSVTRPSPPRVSAHPVSAHPASAHPVSAHPVSAHPVSAPVAMGPLLSEPQR